MEKILESFGEMDVAVNGSEAIKLYEESVKSGNPYDLIMLDIMLPLVDGQTVLYHIRRYEQTHPDLLHVKVIVNSALGDEQTVNTMIKYQCDAYLRKPIDRSVLLKKLHELGIKEEEDEGKVEDQEGNKVEEQEENKVTAEENAE
jgi:two-component system chemotaxis response regulator CheY